MQLQFDWSRPGWTDAHNGGLLFFIFGSVDGSAYSRRPGQPRRGLHFPDREHTDDREQLFCEHHQRRLRLRRALAQNGAVTLDSNTISIAQCNATFVAPPTIAKAFGAAAIGVGGTTTLSFTINNPNPSIALNGVAFTDPLPANLIVSTPNGLTGSCGGGTITALAGSGSVSLTGATLAGGARCTFSVNVTGTNVGAQNNSVTVTSTNGGTGNTSLASLAVVSTPPQTAPPTIVKAFAAAAI